MNNQNKHLKSVAESSLLRFREVVGDCRDSEVLNFIQTWDSFIQNEDLLFKISKCVKNLECILGFSNALKGLGPDRAKSVACEHFAELDLAQHLIREFSLSENSCFLEKIPSTIGVKSCDFKFSDHLFFESKFISNLSENSIRGSFDKARAQLMSTMTRGDQTGIVWIFSYDQSPNNFHTFIKDLAKDARQSGQRIKAILQVYGFGLFGEDFFPLPL